MSRVNICRGYTFHRRHGAVKNEFRYPVFQLHFRADAEEELRATLRQKGKGLLSFSADDYLDGREGSLEARIRGFLRERCGYEAGEIWLQTMPRMFGYAFNPVSFWLCLTEGRLEAALCEVNNTFGERHYYWVEGGEGKSLGEWQKAQKEFHVSPFLPVAGHYAFRFQLSGEKSRNDVFYYDSGGHLELSTWIEGALSPLSEVGLLSLLAHYGWMPPLVVARIHYQAIRLFCKRARFHRKPALPREEVTR